MKKTIKNAEVKAAEVKAAEVKAAEVKAAEVKAAEVKNAEVKAAEVKAAEVKPVSVVKEANAVVAAFMATEKAYGKFTETALVLVVKREYDITKGHKHNTSVLKICKNDIRSAILLKGAFIVGDGGELDKTYKSICKALERLTVEGRKVEEKEKGAGNTGGTRKTNKTPKTPETVIIREKAEFQELPLTEDEKDDLALEVVFKGTTDHIILQIEEEIFSRLAANVNGMHDRFIAYCDAKKKTLKA